MRSSIGFAGLVVLVCSSVAVAQESVPQPAQSAAENAQKARGSGDAPEAVVAPPTRSYDRPANQTIVREQRVVHEEERIGGYNQPRWTARRRFPTTRIYVAPAGEMQVEYWLDSKVPLEDGIDTRFRSQFEAEVGLGHRLQLDVYLTTQQEGLYAPMQLHREKLELRYALADWDVIPGNPTIYAELTRQNEGPPLGELKLLFGGEAAPRWHWGANLVIERELSGPTQGHEYAVTGAVAYTLRDLELSVGAEVQVEATDVRTRRFRFDEVEPLIGPSIQWRPVPQLHVDLVALFGVGLQPNTADSEVEAVAQPLLVVGWEL